MRNIKRVIIADDHSFIRLGLIQILRDEYPSVEIGEVADGKQLLEEVKLYDWDLVISDLDMPVINGMEALGKIKQLKPELPVLILSIYTDDLYALRVLKAGASGYLNKNSAPNELINAIQMIRLGKKYIPSEIAEKLLATDLDKKPHETLSNREFEIFRLLANGKSLSQIAEQFSLALSTVSTHRSRILEKMNLSSNAELARYAVAHKIITDIN